MEIRGFTVKYTKIKARERRDEEKFLQNRINDLIAKAEKNKNNKKIIYELNSTKARLNKIIGSLRNHDGNGNGNVTKQKK